MKRVLRSESASRPSPSGIPAEGHSVPLKPVDVRFGQPSGRHTAPAMVRPTVLSHRGLRPHVPAVCARRRAVATAPGLVLEAMTGWMNGKRFEDPAPQNVASRL